MVKLAYILITFLLFSCGNKNSNVITRADIAMYQDYLDYISLANSGQKSINLKIGVDSNITYYYKDFGEEGVKVLIFHNKLLNQQYIIFYGSVLGKKKTGIQNAPAVKGLNLGKAMFNQEVLKTFLKVEEYIEGKFQKNIKKIVIGNEIGGAFANMITASLIANYGFKSNEFEVVAFGMLPFAKNFKPNFKSISVELQEDQNIFVSTKCCTQLEIQKLKIRLGKSVKSQNLIEDYKKGLQQAKS